MASRRGSPCSRGTRPSRRCSNHRADRSTALTVPQRRPRRTPRVDAPSPRRQMPCRARPPGGPRRTLHRAWLKWMPSPCVRSIAEELRHRPLAAHRAAKVVEGRARLVGRLPQLRLDLLQPPRRLARALLAPVRRRHHHHAHVGHGAAKARDELLHAHDRVHHGRVPRVRADVEDDQIVGAMSEDLVVERLALAQDAETVERAHAQAVDLEARLVALEHGAEQARLVRVLGHRDHLVRPVRDVHAHEAEVGITLGVRVGAGLHLAVDLHVERATLRARRGTRPRSG